MSLQKRRGPNPDPFNTYTEDRNNSPTITNPKDRDRKDPALGKNPLPGFHLKR